MNKRSNQLVTRYAFVAGGAGIGYLICRNKKIGGVWGAVIGGITIGALITMARGMGFSDGAPPSVAEFWGLSNYTYNPSETAPVPVAPAKVIRRPI